VTSPSKYRSRAIADNVIGFSISYQREDLLARGLGLEHLQDLLRQLARPILRQGADLAYGGNWRESEDNFTCELLRLIEQEGGSLGSSQVQIGKLYDYLAWPYYLAVTPKIEAQWINYCRVVRVTQSDAGISASDVVADNEADSDKPNVQFNRAVTLSAMRRLMMQGMMLNFPDVPQAESVPPVVARILLGGQAKDYSGFMPGIFEETLVTIERERPAYILGGFGGAAEVLANAILVSGDGGDEKLTLEWHESQNSKLARLLSASCQFKLPPAMPSAQEMFEALRSFVAQARVRPAETLRTGLSDQETRELLETRDVASAVRLVRTGLINQGKLQVLPA
jgi:hypothetical protein